MKNEGIIFFSSDDWGWKTSKYQLSIRFAKENRLLFVSSIGFRAPSASTEDLGRIARKLRSFFKGLDQVDENLHVLTPLVIPFHWFPFKDGLNRLILRSQVAWAKAKLGMQRPYLFVFSQNWYPHVRSMERKKLVYYCVDEQSSFAGLDGQKFLDLDKKISAEADVVFCTARTLYESKKETNPNTHYSPHGVNYELFAKALRNDTPVAADLAQIDKPVFLFFGHISYDWVDKDLVKYLATEKPNWSWVYVGRYSMDEDEFSDFENIHLLGEKEFESLPSFCKGADVALIPFVSSVLTKNCNPLKLPEYLAAGLPVVSTDIPEVRKSFGDKVFIAKTNEAFLQSCIKALAEKDETRCKQVSDEMSRQGWDQRVEDIYEIIQS